MNILQIEVPRVVELEMLHMNDRLRAKLSVDARRVKARRRKMES